MPSVYFKATAITFSWIFKLENHSDCLNSDLVQNWSQDQLHDLNVMLAQFGTICTINILLSLLSETLYCMLQKVVLFEE